MSERKDPPKDPLAEYLEGKSGISRLYREASMESAPRELDRKILTAARQALRPRWQRWALPLSAAAAVVLSVGVLLRMQQEGGSPVPFEQTPPELGAEHKRESREAPAAAPATPQRGAAPAGAHQEPAVAPFAADKAQPAQAAPAAPPRPAPPVPADEPASGRAREKLLDESGAAGAAPASDAAASREATDITPEDWIERIRQLLAAGQDERAAAELREFRGRYPDYPLPEDLRAQDPLPAD